MSTIKNSFKTIFWLFLIIGWPTCSYSTKLCSESTPDLTKEGMIDLFTLSKSPCCCGNTELVYYLFIEDFIESFIEVPTSNVLDPSSTIASSYLAGRAPIYNEKNKKFGNCSASFLNMQNSDGIFTDISNYLSIDNGLIVSWFTPTTLINLELDSIVHSMVTECIVIASTKIGFNPYYGKKFNMVVSSDDEKIYFKLTLIN